MLNDDFEDYLEMARALLGGYESSNELWHANEYINLALHKRPGDVESWILKSQILSSLDDHPAALAAAQMAVIRAPNSAETYYIQAAVLADMELYQEALEAIERAFVHLTNNDNWLLEDLYYEKAVIFDLLDRQSDALAIFEIGLKHFPESVLLRAGLEPLRREQVRRQLRVIDGGKRD